MRIVLKLKARKTVPQNRENNSKYHTGMHGWVYGKIKNTDFSEVYKKKGFKPFCFGNLFRVSKGLIEEEKQYNLIISCPDEMFAVAILSQINVPEIINLGEYSFELVDYKPLGKAEINENDVLVSETIINVSLNHEGKRKAMTLSNNSDSFTRTLAKNLIRKYNQLNGEEIDEEFDLWKNVRMEEIDGSNSSIRLNLVDNSDNWFCVIGSRYRFELGKINETQKRIFGLCYDLGFGERNSFGFGFMNKKSGSSEEEKGEKNKESSENDDKHPKQGPGGRE